MIRTARPLSLLPAALLAALACLPLQARSLPTRDLVDLDVIDRDAARPLAKYPSRPPYGDRAWIVGEPGHRYAVRLTNRTGERVLVVLSVDGVNAVTGETAAPDQAGYVLEPWESAEINGWRKSLDDVARFYFTDLPDSYAARTGRPDDVGVIGAAVFRERTVARAYPVSPPNVARGARRTADAAAASEASEASAAPAAAPQAQQRLGTGHGERQWSPVGQTSFVRRTSRPEQVVELRYDDRAALAALGIVPRDDWRARRDDGPRAFPEGFVADPPGW